LAKFQGERPAPRLPLVIGKAHSGPSRLAKAMPRDRAGSIPPAVANEGQTVWSFARVKLPRDPDALTRLIEALAGHDQR